MEIQKIKETIEAILFAVGRMVTIEELVLALEIDKNQLEEIIENKRNRINKNRKRISIMHEKRIL